MEAQLHLLPTEDDADVSWRLDETTRAIGRRGVEDARVALRAALRHRHDDSLDSSGAEGRQGPGRHASAA